MPKINDIAQRVKAHPGITGADVVNLADNDFVFAVGQVIHSALRELAEQDAIGTTTRAYTLTNPEDVTVTLDAEGKAELFDLTVDEGVMLEMLHLGTISHVEWEFPLSPRKHRGQGTLESNYGAMHAHYWLEGTVIHTRGDGEPLTGDLAFAVAHVAGLDTLNPQRTTKLVDLVVARLRGVPVPKPEQRKQ